jgi:hypothetical protein
MRKIAWFGSVVLVVGVVGSTLVTTSGAIVIEETLTFVAQARGETGIDADGDHQLTPGDGWISTTALLEGEEVLGKVVSSCQFAKVRPDGMGGLMQCVSTAQLPGGQVTLQQRTNLVEGETSAMTAAVTGGTGDYANARGTATSETDPATGETTITFHLLP